MAFSSGPSALPLDFIKTSVPYPPIPPAGSYNALVNRARMTVSTDPGTGTIQLGAAVSGFQTFAAAGVADGNLVSYVMEDGGNWELGKGTYSASGTSLSRTTVIATSGGTIDRINATSAAQVYCTAFASDIVKLGGPFYVSQYGAVGDGVTDNLAILNAAVASVLAAGGGTLYFPPGYYAISGQWAIGAPTVNSFSFITTRTAALDVTTYNANRNVTNIAANNVNKSPISIEFAAGAYLVPTFSPGSLTPVVGYYYSTQIGNPSIKGLSIITPSMMSGGVYNQNGTTSANNLIGLYFEEGPRFIEGTLIAGCQHGIVTAQAFWTNIKNYTGNTLFGDALNIGLGNAITVENILFESCGRGIVFDGAASRINSIHGELTAQELVILQAECCTFGPGYLEDGSGVDGTGLYSIQLGTTSGGTDIYQSTFIGLRGTVQRPNKGGIRFWGCRNVIIEGCRVYGATAVIDTQSYGILSGCDFGNNAQFGKFISQGDGFSILRVTAPSSDYFAYGPWIFQINSVALGTVASGANTTYTYTVPFTINSVGTFACSLTYTTGGPGALITQVNAISSTQIRITWTNPGAGSISPGTVSFNLLVFQGF